MNNEKYNQIIDEIYEKYHQENKHVMYLTFLLKEEFIRKCKIDSEFSEKWGLKIEEKELSFNARYRIGKYQPYNIEGKVEYESGLNYITENQFENFHNEEMDKLNIPTKQITVTYKDETIEVYE